MILIKLFLYKFITGSYKHITDIECKWLSTVLGEDILNMKSLECTCKDKCNGTVSLLKLMEFEPRMKDVNEESEIIPIYKSM